MNKLWNYEDIVKLALAHEIPLTFEQVHLLLCSVSSCAIENIHVDEAGLARIMYEMCAGNRATLEGGVRMIRVHDQNAACQEFGCAIHSPTQHVLRMFPQKWNRDIGRTERVCLCGVSHPDPDHLNWVLRTQNKATLKKHEQHACCDKQCCTISV